MAFREQAPGTLPPPGPIGRAARLTLGVVTAGIVVAVALPRLDGPPGRVNPSPLFLVLVVVALRLVGDIVEMVLRRPWGVATRSVAVAGIGLLAIVDVVAYGRWWAPPLGWYLFWLVEASFAVLAVSFIAAAVLAAPG